MGSHIFELTVPPEVLDNLDSRSEENRQEAIIEVKKQMVDLRLWLQDVGLYEEVKLPGSFPGQHPFFIAQMDDDVLAKVRQAPMLFYLIQVYAEDELPSIFDPE